MTEPRSPAAAEPDRAKDRASGRASQPADPMGASDPDHPEPAVEDWRPGRITATVLDGGPIDGTEPGATTAGRGEPAPAAAARPPRGRPRARPVDQERDLILRAARASFGELGFHGASIDDIAKRAAIPRRTIYRHFADKDELFVAALESATGMVLGQLAETFGRTEEVHPAVALDRNYRRALELVVSDPSWGLLFLTSMSSSPSMSDLSTAAVLEGRRRLELGISMSIRHRWDLLGVDRPERAEQVASMMVGLVITMGTRLSQEPDLSLDEVCELLTAFTIGGVQAIERQSLAAAAAPRPRGAQPDVRGREAQPG